MTGRRAEVAAAGDGERLDLLVARALEISRTQAATLIATGQVTVEGRREKAGYRPAAGERVVAEMAPPPERRAVLAEEIPLQVVFEDDDVLVVDKPAGMVVHPAPGNWSGTLVNALKGRGGPLSSGPEEGREGIVHRARSARPKAHGDRQWWTAGEDRLRAAGATRRRRGGPAPGAPAHGTDASDPRPPRVARASGDG